MTSQSIAAIEGRIDREAAGAMVVSSQAGGLAFQNMLEVMEFAKMMAVSDVAVRKHLRGNPGACLGVTIQAFEWKMSPFAVANKSYSVNDQLAYEAQLIHAVILSRAPIKGRPKHDYTGDGAKRKLRVWAETLDGEKVEYESPEIGSIKPKNSPLWVNDPDQQLHYFSVRSWCRRHFPEVILGVYAVDEIGPETKDVTPKASGFAERLAGGNNGGFNPAGIDSAINGEEQAEPDPEIVRAGATAFVDGEPRELPEDLDLKTEAERRDWFRGFDEAKAASEGGA